MQKLNSSSNESRDQVTSPDETIPKGHPLGSTQDTTVAKFQAAVDKSRIGEAAVLQALQHFGFESVGSATVNGTKAKVLQDPSGDFAFALLDDIQVTKQGSMGGASAGYIGERHGIIVILPSPSAATLNSLGKLAREHTAGNAELMESFLSFLEYFSQEKRREVITHELTHFDDMRHSRWGQVALMKHFINSGDTKIQVSPAIAARLTSTVPTEEECNAATLLMELKAFCSNTTTDAARCQVATKCCEEIESILLQSDRQNDSALTPLLTSLQQWQRCISAPGSSYQTGGDEALQIAAEWLLEHGTLYPER